MTYLLCAATIARAVPHASHASDTEAVEDLGTDGDVDYLANLLAAAASDGAVLCTHGEILGELLARLRARGVIHRGDLPTEGRPRYEKGSTWVLEEAVDGRFHARYLPPPAPPTRPGRWQGSVRAELGRLALEQQRLLATIAALTATTQQLAADLDPKLAASPPGAPPCPSWTGCASAREGWRMPMRGWSRPSGACLVACRQAPRRRRRLVWWPG